MLRNSACKKIMPLSTKQKTQTKSYTLDKKQKKTVHTSFLECPERPVFKCSTNNFVEAVFLVLLTNESPNLFE